MKFTTGLSIRHQISCAVQLPQGVPDLGPSLLKADPIPGKRLLNFQAVYHADGRTVRIQTRLQATGVFRVIVFAGDIAEPQLLAKLQALGRFLADRESGLGALTMPSDSDDSAAWQKVPVEALVVHCADRGRVGLMDLEV
ncbi:phenol hydroxylase [Staphylotrichum tortipilum]|uniref:Phenol hydroxylase n=1 Tax=Staphylotrichum tortipilum TaxID=2831512 RepID=A0AAN6RLR5_9PEZI|nr:phenol hydroxylase [Staphylotrichum longicolle]